MHTTQKISIRKTAQLGIACLLPLTLVACGKDAPSPSSSNEVNSGMYVSFQADEDQHPVYSEQVSSKETFSANQTTSTRSLSQKESAFALELRDANEESPEAPQSFRFTLKKNPRQDSTYPLESVELNLKLKVRANAKHNFNATGALRCTNERLANASSPCVFEDAQIVAQRVIYDALGRAKPMGTLNTQGIVSCTVSTNAWSSTAMPFAKSEVLHLATGKTYQSSMLTFPMRAGESNSERIASYSVGCFNAAGERVLYATLRQNLTDETMADPTLQREAIY